MSFKTFVAESGLSYSDQDCFQPFPHIFLAFLPPAYEVGGKLLFSQVCPHLRGGGGVHHQWSGRGVRGVVTLFPGQDREQSIPFPGLDWGTGVPHSRSQKDILLVIPSKLQ